MAHAINTLEKTLRGIVLVMALAALLFPMAAWADIVVLDDGTLSCSVCLPDSLLPWWLESGTYNLPIPGLGTWFLVPTAVGLVWLAHKKRRPQFGPNPMASFIRLGKNVIWLLRNGNSLGRWAMLLTYLRIELKRAFVAHGLRLNLSSEMVWGQRLSFPSYDVFATLFEELYLPDAYFFRCANSQPHIIDCGANVGAATAYFLTQHPKASITAFEPDETTFRFLERNANQNGWKHVTLHQAALHRTEERMTFFSRPTAPLASGFRKNISSSEARATELQTVRLSSYITRPVDLLKLDVEGAELGILEDLVETGKLSFVDQIIMEYHHHIEPDEDRLGQFLSLLEQNGFGYELRAPLDLPFPKGRQHNFMMYAYRKASKMGDSRVLPAVRMPFSSSVTLVPRRPNTRTSGGRHGETRRLHSSVRKHVVAGLHAQSARARQTSA